MGEIGVLDIIIFVVFFAGGVVVAIKGFFRELGAKASYFIGFLTAVMFTRRLGGFIERQVGGEELLVSFLTYMALFFIGFFLCRLLSYVLATATEGIGLSVLDRILGFVLGVLEAFVCVALVIWLLNFQSVFNFSKIFSSSFMYNKVFIPLYGWISNSEIIGGIPSMVGK